jgi:uncharacterized membrane protein
MLGALLLTLKITHDVAAAVLVGSVIFNYFLLRPALPLIPPAHAVVIAQRVGNLFTYTGWTALGFLFLSGILRLYYGGNLGFIITLDLYTRGHGRSLALMIFFWFIAVVSSSIMTWVLRPRLIRKLSVSSNPTLADVERRRATQMEASVWLDRFQLTNLIASILALIAGVSVAYGGLF